MDVVVCIGSSCHLKGSRDVIQILERNIALNGLKDQVNLRGSFCMGRCQGGFCGAKVLEILSRELGIPEEEVTKFGGKSNILYEKTK